MPIYVNGKKISSIFVEGKSIAFGYSNGKLVFSKRSGWQVGVPCTLTISSAYNNSIAGTILLNRYDYYENGVITDNYYDVADVSVSRSVEGVVPLSLGAGTSIILGGAANNAESYAPSNGIFNLSASELSRMYRIKKQNGVLELGSSKTATSYYLEPIWGMSVVSSGTSNITLNSGWAIAHNRTSRISKSSPSTYSLDSLGISEDGTWPIYAYSNSGLEMSVAGLTSSTTAHQMYDSQNIRHLGWVTVADGKISSVSTLAYNTGSDITKNISGTNLNVTTGYATDTDGMRVEVPLFTYGFSDMIAPAQDTSQEIEAAHGKNTADGMGMTAIVNAVEPCAISGPTTIRLYASLSGRTGGTGSITYLRYMLSGEGSWRQKNFTGNNKTARWDDLSIPSGQQVTQVAMAGTWTLNSSVSSSWTATGHIYAYQTVTTQGVPQSRPIYAKVTRNQNNNQKTVSIQTSSGDSSPFVSYVYIGTINVPRNGNTGTIS